MSDHGSQFVARGHRFECGTWWWGDLREKGEEEQTDIKEEQDDEDAPEQVQLRKVKGGLEDARAAVSASQTRMQKELKQIVLIKKRLKANKTNVGR